MRKALVLMVLALSACASSAPVRMADGAYMTSARVALGGEAGALSEAVENANGFCAPRGQVASIISHTERECALRGGCGEAQITFRCETP